VRHTRIAAIASLCVLVLACAGRGADAGSGTGERANEESTVLVFAAASLTDAFEEIAAAFEEATPGVSVQLNLGGSSSLREQILDGAPADVFASANMSNMDAVVAEDLARDPQIFATSDLQIVVPAGNPGGVEGLDDFARADLLIGLCASEVPCGAFGRQVLEAAGVDPAHDTDEPDVRALLSKVATGELDAGLVYRTDVIAAGDAVEGVDIPNALNVVAEYQVAALTDATNGAGATTFLDYLLSPEGRAILRSYGFGSP
jgi:molybdate transport system substrate-binding protein